LKRVGLIGPRERPELERLAIRLEERGGQAVFIDPSRAASIEMNGPTLRACGEDLSSIAAVYVADLRLPSPISASPDGGLDPGATRLAMHRSRRQLAAWNALFARLAGDGCLVVNPPAAQELHSVKPYEISAYVRRGLPVPRTLATTDASAVARLGATREIRWVIKGMVGGYSHTERFDPPSSQDDAERLLASGPVQAQELIEGDNVRAFVVGGEYLGAAEFIPLDGTEIDSRRGKARLRRVELPEPAVRHAIAVAELAEMTFAAVDFIREEGTDRYVVLECNSAPFFVAFEASTGIEVSGRLANHLMSIRRKR
jgi:glutathione synthase/RimK-type ligase-like ATP-grasp enzyme